MDDLRCSVHLCLGQEEVPEAIHRFKKDGDWVFSTHRSHGHYLAAGGSPEALLAEIDGLPDGLNGGFSGSQSFCDPRVRFHSTAIVGGLLAAAAGVALGIKIDGGKEIVLCCLGDAATEQGVFWETVNFVALHSLPIVFLCENNGLSVHAPIRHRQATDISERVKAFGVRTFRGIYATRGVLQNRLAPGFCEVECERLCRHVGAMEDLRE